MRYLKFGAVLFQLAVGGLVTVVSLLFSCAAAALPFGMVATWIGLFSFLNALPSPRRLRFLTLRLATRLRRRVGVAVAEFAALVSVAVRLALTPRCAAPVLGVAAVLVLGSVDLLATGPWEKAAENLCKAFTGPIGKGLSLVAISVGGLMFAFGEGGSKSALAGLVFGAGMVLAAPAFLAWLGITGITC